MNNLIILFFAMALFTMACADPATNKPKAETTEPVSTTPLKVEVGQNDSTTEVKTRGEAVPIDPAKSKIEFVGSKVTGKHEGGFTVFDGVVDLVGDKAEDSSVIVEIKMSSVFTDTDGLTKHLQTGDFFEAEKYPLSKFASTRIVSGPANGSDSYTVTGNLEMRGVMKSITFPATISISPNDVQVKAEFSINRKDFGIVYAGKADDLIRDLVLLRLDLTAPRKK